MSDLGLVERINREVLHPLGLAMTRNPETGFSESVLVADDGFFEYSEDLETTVISDHVDLKRRILAKANVSGV